MASYSIDCCTCGGPAKAGRRDTKHCRPCAALKVLEYLRGKYKRARTCRTCNKRFRPASQKDLAYCGPCEQRQQPGELTGTSCALCSRDVRSGSLLPTVCSLCLKDPDRQDTVVLLLHKQQGQRIKEYGHLRSEAPNVRKDA